MSKITFSRNIRTDSDAKHELCKILRTKWNRDLLGYNTA
jgi:hypothetical protein